MASNFIAFDADKVTLIHDYSYNNNWIQYVIFVKLNVINTPVIHWYQYLFSSAIKCALIKDNIKNWKISAAESLGQFQPNLVQSIVE